MLCEKHSCHWTPYLGTAGYGQHPNSTALTGLAWLFRLYKSMELCQCEYIIYLEDDTCIHNKITERPPPQSIVGGANWNLFNTKFLEFAYQFSQIQPDRNTFFGCPGGSYYKTHAWLNIKRHKSYILNISVILAGMRCYQAANRPAFLHSILRNHRINRDGGLTAFDEILRLAGR